MASITIPHGHKNLLFAAMVANETGAEFEEDGQYITISDSPELTIPRYCFSQVFDPTGSKARAGDQLESAWRSTILNKRGYLKSFTDFEIIVTDDKPKDKRPAFLLRFPDEAAKAEAEGWAERTGYGTLTAYILAAVDEFNNKWKE